MFIIVLSLSVNLHIFSFKIYTLEYIYFISVMKLSLLFHNIYQQNTLQACSHTTLINLPYYHNSNLV